MRWGSCRSCCRSCWKRRSERGEGDRMTALQSPSKIKHLADLVARLGGVPLDRIRMQPPPGTATVQDVIDVLARRERRCELIEGVLVEKPMSWEASQLAIFIG